MSKSKLIVFIITIFGIVAIAVINFIATPNHWHFQELKNHTVPFTKDFSVQSDWILFLVMAMTVLYLFFRYFNRMRSRRGLNKRTNRY